MTDKFTYPESHIDEIRNAVQADDGKAALDAALFLVASFLVDVRRIADAMQIAAAAAVEEFAKPLKKD